MRSTLKERIGQDCEVCCAIKHVYFAHLHTISIKTSDPAPSDMQELS